jgi:hypothetical protein
MYIPRKWEYGSALAKLRKFGGVEPPTLFGTPLTVDTSLSKAEGKRKSRSIHLLPLWAFVVFLERSFTFTFVFIMRSLVANFILTYL